MSNPNGVPPESPEVLNISSRAVEKHISKLKEQGVLIRKGSARGGYWRVATEMGEQLELTRMEPVNALLSVTRRIGRRERI